MAYQNRQSGLISLSAPDSKSRARGMCRYTAEGGLIKAELTASQLSEGNTYIAILWAGGKPTLLGELGKSDAGWAMSGEASCNEPEAAFIAARDDMGVRVALAGKRMGANVELGAAMERIRLAFVARERPAKKSGDESGKSAHKKESAPPMIMKKGKLSEEKPAHEKEKTPELKAEPSFEPMRLKLPKFAQTESALDAKAAPAKVKISDWAKAEPQREAELLLPKASPLPKAAGVSEAELLVPPPPQSDALGSILRRADSLFGNGVSDTDIWRDEVDMWTQDDAGQEPLDTDTESLLPPSLDQFVSSGKPRSITDAPQTPPETGGERPPKPENRARKGNKRGPNELLRNSRPSYIKPISNPFPGQFKGAQWVLTRYPGAEYPHYLAARWRKGARELLVSAVPGEYAPSPPPWLAGFMRHASSRWGQGYWLSVSDYLSGAPYTGG